MLPDDLPSWLELFQWIHAAQCMTASYEEEDDVFKVVKTKAQDILARWNFTPLYKDPAIFSNSSQVMLFLKELFFWRLCHNASSRMDNSNITVRIQVIFIAFLNLELLHVITISMSCAFIVAGVQ
jgi:hypothetical protein